MKAFTKKIVDHLPHNITNLEAIDQLIRNIANTRMRLEELEDLGEIVQPELLGIESIKDSLVTLEDKLSRREDVFNDLKPHIDRLKVQFESLSDTESECKSIIAQTERQCVEDPDFGQLLASERARLERLRRDSDILRNYISCLENIESSVRSLFQDAFA